jgi:hypothetical protein
VHLVGVRDNLPGSGGAPRPFLEMVEEIEARLKKIKGDEE